MITIIVGKLGVGKTAEATLKIWKLLTKGKDCYANWEIDFTEYYEYRTSSWRGFLWKWWIKIFRRTKPQDFGKLYYWSTLDDLYKLRNGEVFFDEAHMAIYARDFSKLPKDFRTKLTQSRKYGLNLYFISQHSTQIDKNVRILANSMIKMARFLHFLVFWKEYDGEVIDVLANPEMVAISKPKPIAYGMHFMRKGILKSYDTMKLFDPFDVYDGRPMWAIPEVMHNLSTEKLQDQKKRLLQLKYEVEQYQVGTESEVSHPLRTT